MQTTRQDAYENLNESISEGDSESATNHLFAKLSIHRLHDVVKFLIEEYNDRPDLLQEFWNSRSDACPLEATEQEQQESDFKGFVLSKGMN